MSVDPKYMPSRAERLFGRDDDSELKRRAMERSRQIIEERERRERQERQSPPIQRRRD